MNKPKTLFTFNDEKITIVLFNSIFNSQNILFYKSIPIEKDTIANGFIANNDNVFKKVNELLLEASSFVGCEINEVYVNVDCNEITIKPLELSEITLEDKIFDRNVWSNIQDAINVKQITDKYIYDVNYVSWIIDNKEYHEVPITPIAGNKLIIKAITYQINKILFQNYEILFKKLNVSLINLLPMVNTLGQLVDSNTKNHYELFVYIDNDALVMAQTSAKHVQRCVSDKILGLNNLYNVIADNNHLNVDLVNEIMKTNILFNNNNTLELISDYDYNQFKLKEFNVNKIKDIINDYVEKIASTVNENINFLETDKNIKIAKVTYLPINKITKNLINLTQIHNHSDKVFINNDGIWEYDNYSIQQYLMLNYIEQVYEKKQFSNKHDGLNDKYKKHLDL